MLSKEEAEKIADEILQKEREKSQSKLAKNHPQSIEYIKQKIWLRYRNISISYFLDKPRVLLKIIRYIIKCGMAIWCWHCYLSNIYIDIGEV
ncbi:hypothetical protein [Acinetobacter johnsonii]|uniref:hypothetical protein n=1 Tax=Acinetobacter johnsonii TaxID=40214 RepID=UPI002168967A|nr:hypothetical protein [Acinetobacter johnsonii]MCS3527222.1 hypothetical protein [Acinetobacter johnsonii]